MGAVELFSQVRRKLNITWDDPGTDARLYDIIDSGQAAMSHKLGVAADFDFSVPGQDNALFLSWCLYEWNHAAGEFDVAYASDMLQARQRHMVEAMKAGEGDASETDEV